MRRRISTTPGVYRIESGQDCVQPEHSLSAMLAACRPSRATLRRWAEVLTDRLDEIHGRQ